MIVNTDVQRLIYKAAGLARGDPRHIPILLALVELVLQHIRALLDDVAVGPPEARHGAGGAA